MKSLLIIVFVIVSLGIQAQTYNTDSKNWNYTGYNKFHATKTKVGNTSVTEAKIINYDATVTEINDTVTLQSAISLGKEG